MLSNSDRVQKHRKSFKTAGYRQVQIWVPDTRRQEFVEECAKQVAQINTSDREDSQIVDMMNIALENLVRSGEWR